MRQDYFKRSTIEPTWIRTIPLLLFFFCVALLGAGAETHDIPKSGSSDELTAVGDWHQAFFDAGHTGNNRYETLLNRHNVGNLSLLWASQVGDWPELKASPVISGGKVYLVSGGFDSGRMYAFDALTGATVWVGKEEGLEDLNSAAVGHGLVFASMDGIGSWNGIIAYDADTGEIVWHSLNGHYIRASKTLKGNLLYVADFEGQLYALDAGTGSVLWSTPEECCVNDQAPTVAGGRVFQMRTDATLTAYDARTGQQLWQRAHGISGSTTAAQGKLFVPDDPTLFALDQATGTEIWSVPLALATFGAPAVANGLLFVPQGSGLMAFDADTGALVWTQPTAASSWSPAVANGVVYGSNWNGERDAYDARNGTQLWSVTIPGCSGSCTTGTAAVANGILYLAGPDNFLRAYTVQSR